MHPDRFTKLREEEMRVAHVWDGLWTSSRTRQKWADASPEVEQVLSRLPGTRGAKALDAGCGIGRHIPSLARHFRMPVGVDVSRNALGWCKKFLLAENVDASLVCASMTRLPFPERSFALILAFNVIYHSSRSVMQEVLGGLTRCCREEGYLFVTFLSRRNRSYGLGVELEPGTFVREDEQGDRGLLHHFSSEQEIYDLVGQARIVELVEKEPIVHGTPDRGGYHWFVLLQC